MKQVQFITIGILLFLGFSITVAAQLKTGDIVKIKSVSSGKYAKPVSVDNNAGTVLTNQVVIFSNSNDAGLKWKVLASTDGFVRFQNLGSNKFLGILNADKKKYGMIHEKLVARGDDLFWKLEKTSKGFKLKNKGSNLFAAIEGGGSADNAKLIQWSDDGQNDIVWQFENAQSGSSDATGKKVLFDVVLNYISVSEATRNRIDNGDCRRTFGQVSTELWELDENNEMKTRLKSYNNMPELLYNQTNYSNPPTAGLSQYQDNLSASAKNQMGKVTYNIPETLLKGKKIMLVVKTNIGTRHKDNDFATYDALKMKEEEQNTFILDYRASRTEIIEKITDLTASGRNMHLQDFVIPFAAFQKTDDTHKVWVKFSCKLN